MFVQNDKSIIPKIARILLTCRKPIPISHVYSKVSHNTKTFYPYITFLQQQGMITVIPKESGRKDILITDKGRIFIKLWIELNSLIGIVVDNYVC